MFDDTNGFGSIPDALPDAYGYADREASTVHKNAETAISSNPFSDMGTAAVIPTSPAHPSVAPPMQQRSMPAGNIDMRIVSATPTQAANAPSRSNLGAAGPRPQARPVVKNYGAGEVPTVATYPVKVGSNGKKYREYKGDGGYVYAQYEDGSYAILSDGYDLTTKKRGGYPSGTKQGVPFTAAANSKAFNAIKAEVETAIGPYGAAGKQPVAFQPSGQAADAGTTSSAADSNTEAGSWFTRSSAGVPNWGWALLGTGVTVGAGVYAYRRFVAKKA